MALLRTGLLLGPIAVGIALSPTGLRAAGVSEYSVKAAFLLNFARLVHWPASAFAAPDTPLVLGVVGEKAFRATRLAGIEGQEVQRRPVRLRHVESAGQASGCHLVFVSREDSELGADALAVAGEAGALTVGEGEGFVRRGGIIGFYPEGQKIRFEINPAAAERSGLTISSRLLRLARIAGEGPP